VLGVRTNLRFLRALTAHDGIQHAKADTEFVKRSFEELVPERPAAPDEAYVLAAAAVIAGARDPRDPWTSLGPWRLGEGYASTVTLREGDVERAVRLTGRGPYELNGHIALRSKEEPHEWTIDAFPAAAAREGTMCWVALQGETYELDTALRPRNVELTIGSEVAAPMPGVVIAAQTKADQKVRRGDLLFVVEAMKMELRVEAPADGTVTRVLASVGQQVERGQRLAEFEPTA
jgi:acetyl-CoA/propionyl-CoA carboxylase biotin carboxyl carrier protein